MDTSQHPSSRLILPRDVDCFHFRPARLSKEIVENPGEVVASSKHVLTRHNSERSAAIDCMAIVCRTVNGMLSCSHSVVRAVPEIILGGAHFFSDPSTPRTNMESEPPDPQDT